MSDFGDIYVIDNNALTFLGPAHRASAFFKQHCRIPSEVLHEADGFPDVEELRQLEYRTNPDMLVALVEVMASVPPEDRKLVDLYANRGNADPLVVACALNGQQSGEEGALFSLTWTVVSGDKAVQAMARRFGVPVLTNEEFLARLKDE
ncbi:hypothetical protein [Arthrobacter sp. KNU40]|uniref:hypothetical protein n=1 Tax=Arthrobacter sp. KNU40 TaxID=3447965 RepID=UPI003F5FCFE0